MAAPKTKTKAERETHLGKVAALFCQRVPQYKIAEQLGVDRSMISYDMRILMKRWAKASTGKIDEWKARELERINHMEETYWQAWLDSCKVGVKVSKEKKISGIVVTTRQEIESPSGDPRHLAGVQWCVERRAKMLGLDTPAKPQKVVLTDEDGEEKQAEAGSWSMEEIKAMKEFLAELEGTAEVPE